jgi:hypothetical protein
LLELGADIHTTNLPCHGQTREELFGGCWTPAEVAKAESDDYWLGILQAIKDVVGVKALTAREFDALAKDEWFDT